jgi:uncharacterized protein YdaU (DUF1376 family)
MPFYVQDFRMDTLDLDLDELGVYFLLICLAWRNGTGGVTGNDAVLKKTLKACAADFHGHTYNRIVPKLLRRYFQLGDDNVWYQKRVVLELQKARKLSAKQSQNVSKRWAAHKQFNGLGDTTVIPNAYHHTHKERYTSTNSDSETGPVPPQEVGEKKQSIPVTPYLKANIKSKYFGPPR